MDPLSATVGGSIVFCSLVCIGLGIPLLKGKIKMNRYYGVRFAKSFESEENWYKINKYGAKRLIIWSVPMLIIGVATFFVPMRDRPLLAVPFSVVPVIVVIPVVESYFYARKL